MLKNRGLAFKQIIYILSISLIIFISIFAYNYYATRTVIINKLRENASTVTESINHKIEQIFLSTQKITKTMGLMLSHRSYSSSKLNKILTSNIKTNPDIYGSCIAFAPHAFNKNIKLYAPYAYRAKDSISYIDLSKSYNYPDWDWYKIPKNLNHPYWTEPYFDEGAGNIIMSTYAVPFYNNISNHEQFKGVVTVDISLHWLEKYIRSIDIYRTGYAFIITRKGKIVSYPDEKYIMNDTIFSLAEKFNNSQLLKIGQDMVEGKTDFGPYKSIYNAQNGWIYHTPIKFTGWSLAVFFPEDELLSEMRQLNINIAIISIMGLILLFITIILITNKITKPLRNVTQAAENISRGKFTQEMPIISSNDEIGKLSRTFEYMRKSLIEFIENLKVTTAAKEKIESELNVARKIQMSIIPHTFPAFPKNKEFNIYATIKPAKAVGGDLYDFFMLDDDNLCFVIGDVSGKGVPASLFMAVTRTLLRSKANTSLTAGEILEAMNNDLCVGNVSAMFVTFFICILNINNGNVKYSNAGHNQPFIIRSNGAIEKLEGINGPALGLFEESFYSTNNIKMNKHDRFLLYTDGITEAININNEPFDEKRLLNITSDLTLSPKKIIENLINAVDEFTLNCEQADDITIELLEFKGES